MDWIRGDYVIARRDAEPILRAARGRGAARPDVPRDRASHGAARSGLEQSRRHRDPRRAKDPQGHPLDGIPFHPYYTVKDLVGVMGFLLLFCAVIFFAPDVRRPVPGVAELRARQSAADSAAHRAGLVFHAVLRDVAGGALVRGHAGVGRAGDGRLDPGPVLRALARPLSGRPRSATADRSTRSC